MTERGQPSEGAVLWLAAQAFLFGAMAALLGVVANALFLDTYGAEALPLTYIVIGVAGFAISAAIARASQRFDLLRIAVATLAVAAAAFVASWLVATAGGTWVSGPLLVLFPILIQLGFVFIGGQAGRILDIEGIKASFPRIVTGFPVGAVVGGLVAVPLIELSGRTEHLLLATAIAQAAFAASVWATARRFRSTLVLGPEPGPERAPSSSGAGSDAGPRDGTLRDVLRGRYVFLILVYQVLSALGSQLSDYLVFDRAAAAFPAPDDLGRFIGGYTAAMNAISIGFLFFVAGPLLRRFGLRLGIAANPLVLTVFAATMVVALAGAGAASVPLLVVVAAARIGDIALTDGTTRTSINGLYQVLPPRPRITVQTAVEGVGVPVAIGISGVVILVLNALPAPLAATITVLFVVCAAWTWVGLRLYRAYGVALVDALRRRRELDPDAGFEATVEDVAATRRLVTGEARSVRLGLELASTLDMPALAPELAALTHDPRADVRLVALARLAAEGDEDVRRRLASEVRQAARSPRGAERVAAAQSSVALDASDRSAISNLYSDADPSVQAAAFDAVCPEDVDAVPAVVAALRAGRAAAAAMRAFDRLGDATAAELEAALEEARADRPEASRVSRRMLRAAVSPSAARATVLRRHLDHPDRAIGALVLARLGADEEAAPDLAAAFDTVIQADAAHASRILRARMALRADPGSSVAAEGDEPVLRALDDELELIRERVAAALAARHGRARLGQALGRLVTEPDRGAIAAEAVEVVAGSAHAGLALAILRPGLGPDERVARLPVEHGREALDAEGWLRHLADDAGAVWRSAWLRACAIRALRLRGLDGPAPADHRGPVDPVVAEELKLSAAGQPQ